MKYRIWKYGLAAAFAAVVLAVAGIACAAEEAADPQQPAAARAAAPAAEAAYPAGEVPEAPSQVQQQPAAAAPARAAALPQAAQAAQAAAGSAAGPAARTGEDPDVAAEEYMYMAPKLEPGEYPATRFCDQLRDAKRVSTNRRHRRPSPGRARSCLLSSDWPFRRMCLSTCPAMRSGSTAARCA